MSRLDDLAEKLRAASIVKNEAWAEVELAESRVHDARLKWESCSSKASEAYNDISRELKAYQVPASKP